MHEQDSDRVIRTAQLGEYFHDAVQTTAGRQYLSADDATLHYVASLLCQYARSERVFDFAEQRLQLRPLALLYGEAMEAQGHRERCLWLQRLGDLALFVGGLFSGRLSRHFQDLDYCVAMGGNAYGYLQQAATRPQEQAQAAVFGQLAGQFGHLVDLIAAVTGNTERGPVGRSRGPGAEGQGENGGFRHPDL